MENTYQPQPTKTLTEDEQFELSSLVAYLKLDVSEFMDFELAKRYSKQVAELCRQFGAAMSTVLFETRVSVFVCQPTSHECFVASSSGGHDDWINRYNPRLTQEPDLNNPALVLSVKHGRTRYQWMRSKTRRCSAVISRQV
jgi:hypothetical protein